MSVVHLTRYRRLALPSILLMLSLLVLIVALISVHRSSSIATERFVELEASWEELREGEVQGSDLLSIDDAIRSVSIPVPVIRLSVLWSVAAAVLSLVLLVWLTVTSRREFRQALARGAGVERSEQSSLLKLIDEVTPLAGGDLRVQATQGDSLAGGLAATLNASVADMRWMVSTMRSTAMMVEQSAGNSRLATEKLNADFQEQTAHIHQSSNFLLSLGGTMAEMSASASDTAGMAQRAVNNADVGLDALAVSLNTLNTVCVEASQTAVKMNRLADDARSIEDRVNSINDVAKRTDLLALNTTIRATTSSNPAGAADKKGELGQLADEFGQLVETLAEAIDDVATITRRIATDAADTAMSMKSIGADIDASLLQTSETKQYLHEIRDNSAALSAHAKALSENTIEHVTTVSKLTENMDLINQITQSNTEELRHNDGFLDDLNQLAAELNEGLNEYRVPENTSADSSIKDAPSIARRAANRAVTHG